MDIAEWFGQNILPHEPALRSWLRGRRSVGLDVNDIIQETYALLAAKTDYASIRYPKAYLFRTASSVISAHVRRARIVPITVTDDLDQWEMDSDAPSPEQAVIDRQELHHLMQWIEAMPRQTRKVFTLRRVEGLSQKDVAKKLGISEKTVEKLFAKGVGFLISHYGDGANAPRQPSIQENGVARRPKRGLLGFGRQARNQRGD